MGSREYGSFLEKYQDILIRATFFLKLPLNMRPCNDNRTAVQSGRVEGAWADALYRSNASGFDFLADLVRTYYRMGFTIST